LRFSHGESRNDNNKNCSLVEPVGDGYVLNHVDRVQDIAASWGHGDFDALYTTNSPLLPLHLHDFCGSQLHLGAKAADLLFFDLQSFVSGATQTQGGDVNEEIPKTVKPEVATEDGDRRRL